jgi:glycogen operon protein
MIRSGDELGKTQWGNNNTYCQDNEMSWLDWSLTSHQQSFLDFIKKVISIRKQHFVFRRNNFTNCLYPDRGNPIYWFRPDAAVMKSADWQNTETRSLALMLPGKNLQEFDERGQRLTDDSFLILVNAYWEAVEFTIPSTSALSSWDVLLDTSKDDPPPSQRILRAKKRYLLEPRSFVLLVKRERRVPKRRQKKPEWTLPPPAPAPTWHCHQST